MPSRRLVLLGSLAFLSLPGCALLFKGPTEKYQREGIRWGFVVLDALWWAAVGVGGTVVPIPLCVFFLIIDFSTGAIYKRREGPSLPDDDFEEELEGQRLERLLDGAEPLGVCPEMRLAATQTAPGDLPAFAEAFRRHLETCETCRGALAATRDPVRLGRTGDRGIVLPGRYVARVQVPTSIPS